MPELAEVLLLEARHFEAQVERFLAAKGAAVVVCRAAKDLPPPHDPRWRRVTAIVDVEQAGAAALMEMAASRTGRSFSGKWIGQGNWGSVSGMICIVERKPSSLFL